MSSFIPTVLTIAGSDSGGGAGIQADIKTISATGSYACSVITAITSQNTQSVHAVHPIPLSHIASQLDAVFNDLTIASVKIGMLADTEIIQLVAEKLHFYRPPFIVLDPVMVATSGDVLLKSDAIHALTKELLPLATVITPNLPEAAALTRCRLPTDESELPNLQQALSTLPCAAILLKGGHFTGTLSNDWLLAEQLIHVFSQSRVITQNTHGTGCTLSAAIASFLAQGHELIQAIDLAKQYLTLALSYADQLNVGRGQGPVHHFFALTDNA